VSVEEAERKKKEDYEAKWDLIYMITAVVGTVGVITFFMVSRTNLVFPQLDLSRSDLY
jgi:farnesyl-diphosphate farnesyltransferase